MDGIATLASATLEAAAFFGAFGFGAGFALGAAAAAAAVLREDFLREGRLRRGLGDGFWRVERPMMGDDVKGIDCDLRRNCVCQKKLVVKKRIDSEQ